MLAAKRIVPIGVSLECQCPFQKRRFLISLGELHDQLGGHVQEGKGTGDIFFLEQSAMGCLVSRALEVDQVHAMFHFVNLYVHM